MPNPEDLTPEALAALAASQPRADDGKIDLSNGVAWGPGEREALRRALADARADAGNANDPLSRIAGAIDQARRAIDEVRAVADEVKPFLALIPAAESAAVALAIATIDAAATSVDAADDALERVGL